LICAAVTNGLVLCSPILDSFGNENGASGRAWVADGAVDVAVTSGVRRIARKSGLSNFLCHLYNYFIKKGDKGTYDTSGAGRPL
jgi:hypothetical protein